MSRQTQALGSVTYIQYRPKIQTESACFAMIGSQHPAQSILVRDFARRTVVFHHPVIAVSNSDQAGEPH
jgi:hypothetical protein